MTKLVSNSSITRLLDNCGERKRITDSIIILKMWQALKSHLLAKGFAT